MLITADSGGSNGSRLRLWKTELAALATETGLAITVCHLPPGTSKWNKIEHRLFSAISRSWRARPLTSHEVVIETIRATTTTTGLTVKAELDLGTYEKGIKISDQQMKDLETSQLHRHEFHGDWNYTMHPRRGTRDTPEHTHLNQTVRNRRAPACGHIRANACVGGVRPGFNSDHGQGRISKTLLKGVCATEVNRVKPLVVTTSRIRAGPAWVPRAKPTSWASDDGVHSRVENP